MRKSGPKIDISLLITDIDNTLFDWFLFWHSSFMAMLDKIVEISGLPKEQLVGEIKTIHEKYGTSEYSFVIEELPALQEKHKNSDLKEIYSDAIEEYRKERRRTLALYPTVLDTLQAIKKNGSLIVAYTESREFYTNYRIRNLGLDGIIDIVYSPKDHDLPDTISQLRKYPHSHYLLKKTKQRHTPENVAKPDPSVLLDIAGDLNIHRDQTVYVGDNLVKDVSMARTAGVIDVYAKYGSSHTKEGYDLLGAVTHWPAEVVSKEKGIRAEDVNPSFTLEKEFRELLAFFVFGRFD
jgi:phosphoglycolate phosphatase-like HAD superfamily hydrolase